MRRLARSTYIEARGFTNVDVLIRTFGHTSANDGEIFFLIRAWRVCIDKCRFTGFQIAITNDALLELFRCHKSLSVELD